MSVPIRLYDTMASPAYGYNVVRRRLLPAVHSTLDLLIGGYALSDTPADEYVATLNCSESKTEALLSDLGFSRNLIASLKVRSDGNVSDGSWVFRESLLAEYQLHAILHETDEGTKLYAHWEHSSIRHPYSHYTAQEYSAEQGVSKMRSLLNHLSTSHNIEWTVEPAFRRQTWYTDLLRAVSAHAAIRFAGIPGRFRDAIKTESSGPVQRVVSALR